MVCGRGSGTGCHGRRGTELWLAIAGKRWKGVHTCHAQGTFLRFASTRTAAIIREYMPGPVKVLMNILYRFTRDAVPATAMAVQNAMDLRGSLLADAMMERVNE